MAKTLQTNRNGRDVKTLKIFSFEFVKLKKKLPKNQLIYKIL